MSSDGGDDRDREEDQEPDLSNSDVVTKYKAAAEITNSALKTVIDAAKPGAKLVDICRAGDKIIEDAVAKVFTKKTGQEKQKIEKGIAFPTCCSLNNVVGHYSPLETDTTELKEGDLVKIDLGTHIDGFITTGAVTVRVQADPSAAVTGRAADVIQAAATGLEAAMRVMRPGHRISEVPSVLQKVAEAYGCTVVEGVLSHQLKQFIIDANKGEGCLHAMGLKAARLEGGGEGIAGNVTQVEDGEFEENEAWGIDVVMSTGEGKSRVQDEKETTVYKRALDQNYSLKLKASRAFFSEVQRRFTFMPFTLRALDNKQSRLGLVECLNHGLLHPYPVLHEKGGELVAQFKATVLLMPNGSDRITNAPLQKVESEKSIESEELKKLLQSSLKSKKKNKKKSKNGGEKENEDAVIGPIKA